MTEHPPPTDEQVDPVDPLADAPGGGARADDLTDVDVGERGGKSCDDDEMIHGDSSSPEGPE